METADGGLKVGVAIDGESHQSRLVMGRAWVEPGTEAVTWELGTDTYEAYYVEAGSLRLSWLGPDPGESVVSADEFFFFPPGGRYAIENVGTERAVFVWAITPLLPSSILE